MAFLSTVVGHCWSAKGNHASALLHRAANRLQSTTAILSHKSSKSQSPLIATNINGVASPSAKLSAQCAEPFKNDNHEASANFINTFHSALSLSAPVYTKSIVIEKAAKGGHDHHHYHGRNTRVKKEHQLFKVQAEMLIDSTRATRLLNNSPRLKSAIGTGKAANVIVGDNCVILQAEASAPRVADARRLARMRLANQLYGLLKRPAEFMPGASRRKLKEDADFVVPIETIDESVRKGLQRQLDQVDLSCSGLQDGEEPQPSSSGILLSHEQPFFSSTNDTQAAMSSARRAFSLKNYKKDNLQASTQLPIGGITDEILQSITNNDVTIIAAGTGSGKTTQVPQLILDHCTATVLDTGVALPTRVLVTQPRRIAAISIAKRVADEREQRLGAQVGYSVRFESVHPKNDESVLFCTGGVLLRMLQRPQAIRGITHIILDEVHERDVDTDVLLLLCRRLIKTHGIRLVLMSATMDAAKLVEYFSKAGLSVGPVLSVDKGNPFPIEERYLEDLLLLGGAGATKDEATQKYVEQETTDLAAKAARSEDNPLAISETIKDVPEEFVISLLDQLRNTKSSVLVFMPGWDEIVRLQRSLLAKKWPGVRVHAIHSTVPPADMDAMFTQYDGCKIIVATNIAESSITIPDVTHVIDSGRQKCMWHDSRAGLSRLLPCWASRANMRQRRGRTGRCAPGSYWCLLSKKRVDSLPAHTPPELTRLDLQDVCLNLAAITNDPSQCSAILADALDAPPPSDVHSAIDQLVRIGAYSRSEDGDGNSGMTLTPFGRMLARLPLSPRQSRLLLVSAMLGCWEPTCTTVASVGQRPFLPARLPEERREHEQLVRTALARFGGGNTTSMMQYYTDSDSLALHSILLNNISWPARLHQTNISRVHRIRQNLSTLVLRSLFNNSSAASSSPAASEDGRGESNDAVRKWNRNGNDPTLFRFLLAWAAYPRIAHPAYHRKGDFRKHVYRIAATNSLDGEKVDEDDSDGFFTAQTVLGTAISDSTSAKWLVYSELLDVGVTLIIDATAIDPLHLALIADRLTVISSDPPEDGNGGAEREEVGNEERGTIIECDDLLRLQFRSAEEVDLVMRMRSLWSSMLPALLHHHIRPSQQHGYQHHPGDDKRKMLKGELQKAEDILLDFLNSCTDHRRRVRILSS